MKNKLLVTLVSGLLCLPVLITAQPLNPSKLENVVNKLVSKVQPATVHITDYDTVSKRTAPGGGSGVVVSKDGIILTVAHLVSPKGIYQVTFPDGKKFIAEGLGSIPSLDAAIIRIVEKGTFPYAEMGWSSTLKLEEPCFSIAYPGSLFPYRPVVRFGYVTDLFNQRWKMIMTSCLMEPGDSGGPMFDLYGRVIGVRSRIFVDLESNFDVPVDHFRKYWTALQDGQEHKSLPAEDKIPVDTLAKAITTDLRSIKAKFIKLEAKLDNYTVLLVDETKKERAVGLLVMNPAGSAGNKRTYIITKRSLLTENLKALVGAKMLNTTVFFEDEKNDLALLSIEENIGKSLSLEQVGAKYLGGADLGRFLLSPHPVNEGEVSVVGSGTFDLGRLTYGYLGTNLAIEGEKLRISIVNPASPAMKAGVLVGDEVLSLNDIKVGQIQEFITIVRSHRPGDVLRLRYKRDGKELIANLKLEDRPISENDHPAEQFTDRRSERRDEFKNAYIHDSKLKPAECGGPVFDLKGNFMGINMARFSRTSSIALSPEQVRQFVHEAFRLHTQHK